MEETICPTCDGLGVVRVEMQDGRSYAMDCPDCVDVLPDPDWRDEVVLGFLRGASLGAFAGIFGEFWLGG